MIIDFHTHMFPEKIVEKTIAYLADICQMGPYTNGTYEGLKEKMKRSGVDVSVVLPIVTVPKQFNSINRFAAEHQTDGVISLGSIHPDSEDYKGQLREIKSMGLKGIKFHPDYQEVYFNDIRYKRIISYASELGLIVVTHAGMDPKSPIDVHCTPEMCAEVIKDVEPETLILAHMGGNERWDGVEEYLVGKHVYFDTGVVMETLPQEQFLRIVKNHGADKILFATDTPWADQEKYVEIIKDIPLSEEERDMIFYKNACRLLKL